jgi:predicted metal-dependent peptidase
MMTPEKRIERALTDLVMDKPFYAVLGLRLRMVKDESCPTLCTDGKQMRYGPAFLDTLSDRQVVTGIAHEVLHCAMGHIWRLCAPHFPDHKMNNQACDYEINDIMVQANEAANAAGKAAPFEPIKNWLWNIRFRGMSAEEIYRILEKEKREGKDQGNGDPTFGEFELPQDPKADPVAQRHEWEQATIRAAQYCARGDCPVSIRSRVEKLTHDAVDWKAIMRAFVTRAFDDYSWKKPNMRYGDLLIPGLRSERLGKLCFVVDISSSVSTNTVGEFLGQIQIVLDELQPEELRLMSCSMSIKMDEVFHVGDQIPEEIPIGGGTDFAPPFDRIAQDEEPPLALVYLTDLECSFPPEVEYPVLWVVWGSSKEDAPFGETVHVTV